MQLKRNMARLEQRYGRRAYLVADGALRGNLGDHLEIFLNRLAKMLPKLDLVVLDTNPEQVAKAVEQEDELWPLWEILDLLPDVRSRQL